MLILKVLNGPLFGAELALPDEDCFIRIVDSSLQAINREIESSLNVSANMPVLTIPLSEPSPNFTVRAIADAVEPATVRVSVFDDEQGCTEQDFALNAPLFIGALRVAIRHGKEPWSDAVLSDRGDVSAIAAPSPQQAAPHVKFKSLPGLKSTLGLALGFLGIVTGIALIWPSPVPAQDAWQRLTGVPGVMLESSDGVLYVVTPHADASAVARRTLRRAGWDAGVQVLTQAEATRNIEELLEDAGVRYFAVRMSNPLRPVLLLRRALSDEMRSRLRGAVAYASDFDVLVRTEDDAQHAARRLVTDLGVKAEFTSTPDRFVVSIDDYMSDTQLDALGRALDAYRAQWGKRYVHFVINQRDLVNIDGIKTGGFGYELRGTRHLFFQSLAS